MEKSGKIHLYFGYGKGKTTAGVGLCVRAAGAGKKVLVYQFLKDDTSNERRILEAAPNIVCLPGQNQRKFIWEMSDGEKRERNQFYKEKLQEIQGMEGDYDLIFLDELLDTVSYGILEEEILLAFMEAKEAQVELVITGHEEHENVIRHADYVTRMEKIKHPFDQGCPSREGIEH